MFKVQSLHIYPVKSCHGIELSSSDINDWGLQWDREWIFADSDGQMMTQRTHAVLSRVHTQVAAEALLLSAHGHETLYIPYERAGAQATVQVWESSCTGLDQGDEAAAWIAAVCGLDARLLRYDPRQQRTVDIPEIFQNLPAATTAFADGFPMLIISQASLDDLNNRLQQSVSMQRFRPNIVISGCEAYAEDSWQKIIIGTVPFDIVKPCERCNIITINQETGVPSVEPLRVIARYREGVNFGMNAIHRAQDAITVGDAVQVVT